MQRSHPSAMMILVGVHDVAKSGQLQLHEITTPENCMNKKVKHPKTNLAQQNGPFCVFPKNFMNGGLMKEGHGTG